MSCSNHINPWTTSIQPLKLADCNYYLEALLSFLTELEIDKYEIQRAMRHRSENSWSL